MTKLAKIQGDYPWWEDAHAQLKTARVENNELAEQLEGRIRAGYLRQIRLQLEQNPALRKIAAEAEPAAKAKPDILRALGHLARFGSDDLFEESVDQILRELEVQRKNEGALYLVNDETGELVMPLTENDLFVPPDYVDEDGVTRPGRPVVHPGISAGLAMRAAEAHRRQKVVGLAEDPVRAKAYEHLLEPERILPMVKRRLEHAGIKFAELADIEEKEVEFGRESAEGSFQSVNPAFHRSNMFASVLAQKILNMCGGKGEVELGEIRPMKDNKSRWFVIGIRLRSAVVEG
jgi:hypothetical protein